MTQPPGYPPAPGDPYGAQGDPYGTPGQPPQQPQYPAQPQYPPGYGQPDPYAAPTSGNPYAAPQPPQQPQYPAQPQYPPTSAQPYPTSGQPYPTSGQPYAPPGQPMYPPTSGQPFSPAPGQTSAFPADPYAAGYQGFPPQQPVKKKRGLTITLIILAVALVLCGGGGAAAYFVLRDSGGPGQSSPVEAVNAFLKAVYKDKDADAALKTICSASRDKTSITKRIEEIRKYDSALKDPTYTWQTPVEEKRDKASATVNAAVKVTTSDDKVAESKLKFLTTSDNGWWVCEISAG
jgi:hypothetical protein